MNELKEDNLQRRTASQLLACSLLQVFPGVQLMEVGGSPLGFSCTFQVPHPMDEAAMLSVEEQMRQNLREGVKVEKMEMLAGNAADLLNHKGQPLRAQQVGGYEGLVELIRVGNYCDFPNGQLLDDWDQLFPFRLLRIEDRADFCRIEGVLAEDKQKLKKKLKLIKSCEGWDHRTLAPKLALLHYGAEDWIWGSRGGVVLEVLREWWRAQHPAPDYWPSFSGNHNQLFIAERPKKGVFRVVSWFEDRDEVSLYVPPDHFSSELISSLHFLKKTVNILGFEPHLYFSSSGCGHSVTKKEWRQSSSLVIEALKSTGLQVHFDDEMPVSVGPRFECRVDDELGRTWTLASLEVDLSLPAVSGLYYDSDSSCSPMVLRRSLFESTERWLALLLESRQGRLPLSLAPIQVRVLCKEESCMDYADSVLQKLRSLGWRCDGGDSSQGLKESVFSALSDGVGIVLAVGSREAETQTVSVREMSGNTRKHLSLELLLKELEGERYFGEPKAEN